VTLAVAVVLSCATGVWALWRVFVVSAPGRRLDQLGMVGAQRGRTRLWQYAEHVLEPVSVLYGAVALVVVVSIAVMRRRFWLALQAALLLGGAVATTQVLKRLVLDRPDLGDIAHYGHNTLPSGHTTAAAATSAALLFVVGPRWRPAVAVLGAVYTVLIGWSTLIGQWHRPADVMAAVLVVTAWFALACLLMVVVPPETVPTATTSVPVVRPALAGRVIAGLATVGALAGLVTAVMVAGWWDRPSQTASGVVAYGVGVAAIVAAVGLGVAVQLALREAAGRCARPSRFSAAAHGA